MAERVSVIVLAGGKSSRMGQDKLWMMLDGQPLIERVLRRVLPLSAEVLVSAADATRYQTLLRSLPVPGRVVADEYPGFGPLAGIQAGLSAASNDIAVVIAADMPFVSAALLRHLVALCRGYDGVVPRLPDAGKGIGGLEPLHAVYRRTCLPAIEKHLAANDRQVLCFFGDVRVKIVTARDVQALDPQLLSFFNVNRPEDWQEAQRLVERATRP